MPCNVIFKSTNRIMSNAQIMASHKLFGGKRENVEKVRQIKRVIIGNRQKCLLCAPIIRLEKGKFVKMQDLKNADGSIRKYQHRKDCTQFDLF